MSKFVQQQEFADPIELEIVVRDEPHAGAGQVRVLVTAAGLNPVDWKIAVDPEAAEYFGLTTPAGFGNDYAGVIDEVGAGVSGFAVGDRVLGGARGRAVAEHVIADPDRESLVHIPDGLDDERAGALEIAARTA